MSFSVGLAAGLIFMAATSKPTPQESDWFWNILIAPGAILVAPIYILTGGVHGDFALVEWTLAALNGLGYLLIVKIGGEDREMVKEEEIGP